MRDNVLLLYPCYVFWHDRHLENDHIICRTSTRKHLGTPKVRQINPMISIASATPLSVGNEADPDYAEIRTESRKLFLDGPPLLPITGPLIFLTHD